MHAQIRYTSRWSRATVILTGLALVLGLAAPAFAYTAVLYKNSSGNAGTWYYTTSSSTREGGSTTVLGVGGGQCTACTAYAKTRPAGSQEIEASAPGRVVLRHGPRNSSQTLCRFTTFGGAASATLKCYYYRT